MVVKNEREREREWVDISLGFIIMLNKLNWMVILLKYIWYILIYDIFKVKKEEFFF